MKIAVVIASRLCLAADEPVLLLERALSSVVAQTARAAHELRAYVGVDPAAVLPRLAATIPVTFVHAGKARQSCALNCAVAAALQELPDAVALLEDDDSWAPEKLELQLPLLEEFGLVTTNQRVVDIRGSELEVFDFPTPSGWLMNAEVLRRVGSFDESVICHPDTEWLGRANALGIARVHLVTAASASRTLDEVAQRSQILRVGARPLVTRLFNEQGTMGQIRDGSLEAQSRIEYEAFVGRFGEAPF